VPKISLFPASSGFFHKLCDPHSTRARGHEDLRSHRRRAIASETSNPVSGSLSPSEAARTAACTALASPKIHGRFLRCMNFLVQNCAVWRQTAQDSIHRLPLKSRLRKTAKTGAKNVRKLEIRCSIRLSYGRRRTKGNRASAGCNLDTVMSRLLEAARSHASRARGPQDWALLPENLRALFGCQERRSLH
jgi:hypothetical protein